jgi:hypothetical protein
VALEMTMVEVDARCPASAVNVISTSLTRPIQVGRLEAGPMCRR